MKKLNRKGFTLIELLAVITILGILMLVAIPAVSRTIENSRRNTFLDNAQQYVKAATTQWAADNVKCGDNVSGALSAGTYYIPFATNPSNHDGGLDTTWKLADNAVNLVDQGGKSSWGNSDVAGVITVVITDTGKAKYYIAMTDKTGHGISSSATPKEASKLDKTDVLTTGATLTKPSSACYVVE